MGYVKRVWLAGTLVLAVAATVAAPVSAQPLPGQADWQQQCSSLGGNFSTQELGGLSVKYVCEGVPDSVVLSGICFGYPDFKGRFWFGDEGGLGTEFCFRSGVAPVKLTVGPKVTISHSALLSVAVKYNCDPQNPPAADIFVQVSQPSGSGTGRLSVVCTGRWEDVNVAVTGGPFTPGQADVTAWGVMRGVMGDRDVRKLQVVSGLCADCP